MCIHQIYKQIIKWNSISCNNSYNDYLSYSNISINIYGSNVNKTFNFTSNLITSQYVANLDNNTLYTLSTTVYNNANNSNNALYSHNVPLFPTVGRNKFPVHEMAEYEVQYGYNTEPNRYV